MINLFKTRRTAGRPSSVGRPSVSHSKRGDLSRRVSRPRLVPPSIKENKEELLRFAALGGLEEIGRNCMFFEYKDEIVILDLGLQFPEEETPGIDFIIPNISYLAERKKNIAAIILTHAHYDHIGAIPYLI
ncbi:MAG: MBL fold metallo-hydrolase, partial [Candidatus Brennerbacteria bacterium]|nr:MBL fold metallo-hydrolase [Candidatus Brennerbacteria bacterium]